MLLKPYHHYQTTFTFYSIMALTKEHVLTELEDPKIFDLAEYARNGRFDGRLDWNYMFDKVEKNVNDVFYNQVLHEFKGDHEVMFALWKFCHAYMTIIFFTLEENMEENDGRLLYSMEINSVYESCNDILSTNEKMKREVDNYFKTFPIVSEDEAEDEHEDEAEEIVNRTDDSEPPSKAQKTE